LNLYMLNKTHAGSYLCIISLTRSVNYNDDKNIIQNVSVMLKSAVAYAHLNSRAPNEPQFTQEIACDLPVATTPASSTASFTSPALASTSLQPLGPTSRQPTKPLFPTTTAQSSAGDDNVGGGRKHLKQFYIAVGVVGVFGSVIATLSLVVVCTCVKYRKMLKGMQESQQLFCGDIIIHTFQCY